MKKLYSLMSLLLILLFIFSSPQINAQLLSKKTVGLELAKKLAAASEAQAIKDKLTVVISIVDDGGNLAFMERMDGAQLGSIEISLKKAKTALSFKRPTKSYQDRIAEGANGIIALQNVLPFEGGIPLVVEGELVGAIGVSGGTSAQDGVIANAAVELLGSTK
jgi:glc operon protein GlcG